MHPDSHILGPRTQDPQSAVVLWGSMWPSVVTLTWLVQAFLESSGDAGVVYVSLGTVCSIGPVEFKELASALSALPAHVVWKVGKDDLPAGLDLGSLGLGNKVKVRHLSPGPRVSVSSVSGLNTSELEWGMQQTKHTAALHAIAEVFFKS